MRALLSTIGSRGDVQPLVALARELRVLGHDARLCVPPDFREWIEGLGFEVVPIGPALRATARPRDNARPLTAEQRRTMIEGTIAAQFTTIRRAAHGCDLVLGATALQIAAPSVAEHLGLPYVFVAYCPTVLPSARHAPPVLTSTGDVPVDGKADFRGLWQQDAQRWNEGWKAPLNAHRAELGLAPVRDVRRHVHTDRPWLAADRTLAPLPDDDDGIVTQTDAWIVPDERPLSTELETFLAAGDPPIHLGFGSIAAPEGLSRSAIEAARALGFRMIVQRGWASLLPLGDASDCLGIDEVNQQALFGRVAAVVHHGGAGTTTAAARAGAPQIVVPRHYDQFYWAARVLELGIGVQHAGTPTTESLTDALRSALTPERVDRARVVATEVRTDGARVGAQRLGDWARQHR